METIDDETTDACVFFILRRLAEMVEAQPELTVEQPWKAVAERNHGWFGALMDEHYAGDDTNVRLLARGILAAYAGISVEDFEESADRFLRSAQHPSLGRSYLECAYTPMVELLDYLTGNGFPHQPEADYLDDGPGKPVRIWNRVGRRPILAAGNSNGDTAMLEFTHHLDRPTLRLLVLHDDPEREFDYTTGAEQAPSQAQADGWTVVSIKNDWATVFPS